MKENIERARRRKIEEDQRQEAEKQERIRLKLASLGPDPRFVRKQEGEVQQKEADERATHEKETNEEPGRSPTAAVTTAPTINTTTAVTQSPPKPPQPLASGEPQQYGMMKVHPLDSIKKMGASLPRPVEAQRLPVRERTEPIPVDQA